MTKQSEEKDIYILQGKSGEYSSRVQWLVRAYLDENEAIAHMKKAEEWTIEKQCAPYPDNKNVTAALEQEHIKVHPGKNPYDELMKLDYTGVFYEIVKVKFEKITK